MTYKIGESYDVLIPGFAPAKAFIDNIRSIDGQTYICFHFSDEYFYMFSRTVTAYTFTQYIIQRDKPISDVNPYQITSATNFRIFF